MEITYQIGIPDRYRKEAAKLYDEAFGEKFSAAVAASSDRIRLLADSFDLKYAICAFNEKTVIGLVGFQTPNGSLTSGITYRVLLQQLGFIKSIRAALIFSLYERIPANGELVMDGIAVLSSARGGGVGTKLLSMLRDYGLKEGFSNIRLDVVDTNKDAQKLYERFGFKIVSTDYFPYLRWLLSFGASSTMKLSLFRAGS